MSDFILPVRVESRIIFGRRTASPPRINQRVLLFPPAWGILSLAGTNSDTNLRNVDRTWVARA